MKYFKIINLLLFTALLVALFYIWNMYDEMVMFKGMPPFYYNSPGSLFVDALDISTIWAGMGAFTGFLAFAIKKRQRSDRDNMLFQLFCSMVALISFIYRGVSSDNYIYSILDSGDAVAVGNYWHVLLVPLAILAIQFVIYPIWGMTLYKNKKNHITETN